MLYTEEKGLCENSKAVISDLFTILISCMVKFVALDVMVCKSCQDFAILLIMWSAEKLSGIIFVGRSNLWEVGERGNSGGDDVLLIAPCRSSQSSSYKETSLKLHGHF